MNPLKKTALIIVLLIYVSCGRRNNDHTWLYRDESAELLNGRVKEVVFLPKGDSYKFDDYGNMIYSKTMVWFPIKNIDTAVELTYEQRYDKNGLKIATIGTNIKNHDKSIWYFEPNGRIVNYKLFFNNPRVDHMIGKYKYDSAGNMIERFQIDSAYLSPINDTLKLRYDNTHHCIEFSLKMEDLHLIHGLYKYQLHDQNKNWIKMISTEQTLLRDTIIKTITRKITYY